MTSHQKTNSELNENYIATDRYTSDKFAKREMESVWKRTWLWACRNEDIPRPGSVTVFDIAGQSVLIVRQKDNTVKAFHNVCPHRGRVLVDKPASVAHITCPFHSWQWEIDGSLKRVLDRDNWDGCEHMSDENLKLNEVSTAQWGGFIFINLDKNPMDFDEFISPVPDYLSVLGFENMQYCWKKTLLMNCNWKVAQEAFMESYHVMGVHPQFLPVIDESNYSQAQGLHGHHIYTWERPPGAPSHRTGKEFPEDFRPAVVKFFKTFDQTADKSRNGQQSKRSMDAGIAAVESLEAGVGPQEIMEAAVGAMYMAAQNDKAFFPLVDEETAAKIGVDWNIFPNMSLVLGYDGTLIMRARPHNDNPNQCTLDLYAIIAWGEGKAPKVETEYYENWRKDSDNIPFLLMQDVKNMEEVQKGLQSDSITRLRPNPVQEHQIIHFHQVLDKFIGQES